MRPEYDFSGGERGRFFHRNARRRYGLRRLDAGAFRGDDPEQVVAELQHTQAPARADHQTADEDDSR